MDCEILSLLVVISKFLSPSHKFAYVILETKMLKITLNGLLVIFRNFSGEVLVCEKNLARKRKILSHPGGGGALLVPLFSEIGCYSLIAYCI